MTLPEKQVTCACGHRLAMQIPKEWCVKCGRPVFYDAADGARHRRNTYYATLMLIAGIGLVVYFFIEIIATQIRP